MCEYEEYNSTWITLEFLLGVDHSYGFFFSILLFKKGKECMQRKYELNRTEQVLRQDMPSLSNRSKTVRRWKVMDKQKWTEDA